MCAIIFTSRIINKLEKIIKYSKRRGPDKLSTFKVNEFTLVHQLLSITGSFTEQPFKKDNIYCIFNGEIYNYNDFGNYDSDGECLIDLYLKHGNEFIKKLDGEFAIILLDLNKNKLILSTDVFTTKPLYYSIKKKDIGIATYESNLIELGFEYIKKLEANKTLIYNMDNYEFIQQDVYTFNLDQKKSNLDDIFIALENAILKRATNLNKKFFIGLSSGYDSGTIAACLNKHNIDYTIYTIQCREDINTLKERHKIHKGDKYYLVNNKKKFNYYKKHLIDKAENYKYKNRPINVEDDKGTVGVATICDHANSNNIKIMISGQGPDEIMSDYSINGIPTFGNSVTNTHTSFNGVFPKDLKKIFPWKNFFGNTQEDYIMKEEIAAGSYGIESRYPFLDVKFVQEFLNLDYKIKNKDYKYVFKKYMEKEKYPYIKNFKVGFSANHNLINNNTDWIILNKNI